jgi:hypothetical protein
MKIGGYEASGRCWIWPADGGTELRAATRRLYFMWHPLSCIEYEKVLRKQRIKGSKLPGHSDRSIMSA